MDAGIETFDEKVDIESPNPSAIREWLTLERRVVLLALSEVSPNWVLTQDALNIMIVDSLNPLNSSQVLDEMNRILAFADHLERSTAG